MKLILYKWGSNSDNILERELVELGHEVIVYDQKCEHYTKDIKFAQGLINHIHEYDADAVISNDYFPIISMVCNTVGVLYYSWVYDSPHYTLFASTSKYPCNRIRCFDRALVERLNNIGIETVLHLPLGVDWDTCLQKNELDRMDLNNETNGIYRDRKYFSDVSFVGSLYTDAYNYYDELCDDSVIKKRADECIKEQCFEYCKDCISSFFDENYKNDFYDSKDEKIDSGNERLCNIKERIRNILSNGNLLPGDEYTEDVEYIFSSHFLEKKVTVEERRQLLTSIAEQGYDFALYTGSDLSTVPELNKVYRGRVDYYKEMPCVFKNSRINLNITLRSIKTGIPLRALDIMGCGGFLLSNYQEELAEFFKEGREIVMFYSLDDCLEKVDYYLRHEDERKRIADAGFRAVNERFNYRNQLRKLLGET